MTTERNRTEQPNHEPTRIGEALLSTLNRVKADSLTPEQREALDQKAAKLTQENEERECARRVRALADCLGKRYGPDMARLDTFLAGTPEQKSVLARLRAFVQALPEHVATGRGLLLYGLVGTGKDHLLAAALYESARLGYSTRWVNGQEIYGRFRDAIDGGQRESDILAELTGPQVLGISDPIPPVEKPTPYNLQQLYRLLDKRYREMKCTWVSLNAVTPEDADAKLSAPIFDRLRDGAELVRCFWPSYRERSRLKTSPTPA